MSVPGVKRGLGKIWTEPPTRDSLGVLSRTFPPFCTHYVLSGPFSDGVWTRSFDSGCGCHWPREGSSCLVACVYRQTRWRWGSGWSGFFGLVVIAGARAWRGHNQPSEVVRGFLVALVGHVHVWCLLGHRLGQSPCGDIELPMDIVHEGGASPASCMLDG